MAELDEVFDRNRDSCKHVLSAKGVVDHLHPFLIRHWVDADDYDDNDEVTHACLAVLRDVPNRDNMAAQAPAYVQNASRTMQGMVLR